MPKDTDIMTCECSDSGCAVHKGESACNNTATVTLYRIDMVDSTGTLFCEDCAADALDSGLFDTEKNFYS
jgi:hypothetical protein